MSDNPRLLLAFFWLMLALRSFSAAVDAHTATVAVVNAIGAIFGPILAYCELRRGLAERKERLNR